MAATINIQIPAKEMTDQDCQAGSLLKVYDDHGEAIMLNQLHAMEADTKGGDTAVMTDGSVVELVGRLGCYSFQQTPCDALDDRNALRTARFERPFEERYAEPATNGNLAVGLTHHGVLSRTGALIAEEHEVQPVHRVQPKLVTQMAPDAMPILEELVDDVLTTDADEIKTHVREIERLLAERILKRLPAEQRGMLAWVCAALGET